MAKGERHKVTFSEAIDDHSIRDLVRRLRMAVRAVEDRIRVSSASRVAQWNDSLIRLHSKDRRSVLREMLPFLLAGRWDHPYEDGFRAIVDSRMFIEIVEQLLDDLSEHDLHDLISGNYMPGHDSPTSRARDREFELFIGAMYRRSSGLDVCLLEPDIQIGLDGQTCSIAAKRLVSRRKVERNLKKAADQIAAVGQPGLIFLDISMILDPSGTFIAHWTEANQVIGGKILAFENAEYRVALQR